MLRLFHAVENEQLGAVCELENCVFVIEAKPFDGPVQSANYEDAQRNDLNIGADFSGAARIQEQLVPVFGVGSAQGPMWLLKWFGQLAIYANVGGCEVR